MKDIKLKEKMPPPARLRPHCPQCSKPLRPMWHELKFERVENKQGFEYQSTLEWRGRYHGYGAFCTLRCCETFANRIEENNIVGALLRLECAMTLKEPAHVILQARHEARRCLRNGGFIK